MLLAWRILPLFAAVVVSLTAGPITLSLNPSSPVVTAGDSLSLDVVIAGLYRPPEVGSFDVFVGYDPALLSPIGVTFGPFLGDLLLFEALADFNLFFAPSIVEAAEVSLLSTADLNVLQPASFTLFTIDFLGIADGAAAFHYLGGPIDDGNGDLIFGTKTLIPEPGSLWLLGGGVCALAWRKLRSR